MVRQVREILDFIGTEGLNEQILKEKIKSGADPALSSTFRTGGTSTWRSEMSMGNVRLIKKIAPGLLSGMGYERTETWDLKRGNLEQPLPIDTMSINSIKHLDLEWDKYESMRAELNESPEKQVLLDGWALISFIRQSKNTNVLRILKNCLLASFPRNPRWNYLYAIYLHAENRELDEALMHYSTALEGKKGLDEFYTRYNRAILYKQAGNIPLARVDLERALAINPGSKLASELLASLN